MQVFMNYVMVLLMALFIVHVLVQYKYSSKGEGVHLTIGKLVVMTMMIVGHGTILVSKGITNYSLQIIGLNAALIFAMLILSHIIPFLEPVIWHIIALLHLIGSITLHRLEPDLAVKHNLMGLLGFGLMILIGYLVNRIKFFSHMTYVYIAVAITMLLMVNTSINGSKNWFSYGGFSFQPSEFVKIIFAFFLASVFKKAYSLTQYVIGTAFSAVVVLILVYQRDLGSALLFFSLYMVISYMYSRKRWLSILQGIALSIGAYFAYIFFSHVRTRVYAWLDPFEYIDKEGYQITQGLFAFANGKWMGTGLTLGSPKKIPVVSTDFIFAAIGEEYGSIFSILLIVLYLVLIIILLSQCQKTYSIFNAYVSVGLVVMFGFQGFLILGGVLKLIPLTGVTLPFISYGGTSLIATILSIGFVEAITKAETIVEQKSKDKTKDKTKGKSKDKSKSSTKEKSKKKVKAKKKEYRTHTIITIKFIMAGLYSLLILFFIYFLVFQSNEIQLNTYNSRLSDIEQSIVRGSIYDKDGTTLAYSSLNNGSIRRNYPYNDTFAHVVGYSQVGKTGIEAYLNTDLLNANLSFFEQIGHTVSGDDDRGSDVYLTLDAKLQQIASDALGDRKGAVVAIEPSTGKILAMVSKPGFNANEIESVYSDLIKSEEGELLNRATNGVYPPGSTFKLVTALQYVHENGEDFHYFCKGLDIFGHKYIHCYGDSAHGRMTLESAFAMSCNTSFSTMGESISMTKLQRYTNDLLFNDYLPYDYDHETSRFILPEEVSKELRAETVIGQGEILMTPLHNALLVSAIANGGLLMKPYLVDEIHSASDKLVSKNIPEESVYLFDTDDTKLLKELMSAVVTDGTGKGLLNEDYSAAGKTGAAENPFGETHAWFIGFAPASNPEIAIAVIVENAGSSSANSVPIAREMFDYYIMGIEN